MRVLLVSWEYPPVVVGGLGRHVHHLALQLRDQGHDVVVVSRQPTGTDPRSHPTSDAVVDGIRVIMAAEDPLALDFGTDMMPWVLSMGHSMLRAGLRLAGYNPTAGEDALHGAGAVGRPWVPDVVHAHDWLAAHAAVGLAEAFDTPLVATIHATEAGRHSGWVSGPVNRQVHSTEWWLANEADAVITCSRSMSDEVNRLFGPGLAQLHTIANGIDATAWPYRDRSRAAARRGAPRLLYVGRLEYEKGVQDLIAALARVRRTHPGTTLTVAGDGTQAAWLREVAREQRVLRAVEFTGALDHEELVAQLHSADALVIPSRYEPFGIVALEGAATGIPVIATTAGGLADFIRTGETGLSVEPADVPGLTAAIRTLLDDPASSYAWAGAARAEVEELTWEAVAHETAQVYLAAKRRPRTPLGRRVIDERPLPERDPTNPL
ncbi:glycosyltransferase family 4 protein [Tsukamurella tyrosinosolvens]|uniref:glycosyltransferase family 4 protein n=1 Tax=Tsukamurella tyrosinosolvens TaxID=57704 RepID=UPI0007920F6E|nr:glycosyltransferase family 4 protein [Tsukamurella tyrosinosolvens]KXP04750.1 glycogen synthase [Tsukamurella tyrosinosolvens]KZL98003.1 glycogen synthase [Tsukamurella tyrosinosolvens]MCA4995353.1 glycosyltransferase family 4 protein [Tsukamurella tyrosinosolvens]WEL92223.1 glycosyltransferase family 4 protein [Tsukamurella tyrosinosolvens]